MRKLFDRVMEVIRASVALYRELARSAFHLPPAPPVAR